MTTTRLPGVGRRDHAREQSSLQPLLSPRSVAVVGALQRHGGAGYETVRALRDFGFQGRLIPVNGSGRPVCGFPGRPAIVDLPVGVDLLVLAVPPDRVPQAMREAGRRGVRSAVVLSATSSTARHDDRQRREDLLRIAREHGVRLVGPNSLGVLNTDPRVRLNASLSPVRPRAGGLALASESGAVGIALLEHATRNGCGVAAFVSLGDRIDVSSNDLLRHWHADPYVRGVALQLDSFGNPAVFARAVRDITRDKPVLVVTSQPADAALEALFAQAGVVRASDLDELADAARLLTDQPLPTGRRLGIVGNAGGLTTLAARAAEATGFAVPALGRAAGHQLPSGQDNPVDLGVDASPSRIAEAAEAVAGSGEIDILLLMIVGTRANVPDAIMTAVADVVDAHPHLTAAAVFTGCADDIHHLGARNAPVYRQQDRAVRALAHAYRYAMWRRTAATDRSR